MINPKDEDGLPIRPGDMITFTFGIPPICVLAQVTTTGGDLHIECHYPLDVKPKREKLAEVMKWYQVWRASKARIAAFRKTYGQNP